MRCILNFQSINRSSQPKLQAMKRAILIVACCFAVLSDVPTALAASVSDQEMANRYERAAQAGDDDAQFYLGAFHSAGAGRQRSDQEAFRWFQRAADQGHSHAMLLVAGLYASGRGITKDNVKAYRWAHIVASASKVDEDRNGARQLMSLLMKRMTSDEIGHAVVAARAWRAVRVASPAKASTIERAADSSADQPAPAAPPPAPAVVPPAPAVQPSPSVSQPAPSNIAVMPAPAKAAPASPSKNANAQNLLDQVPQNLRKRFGF
jgi:hypothetical protein